MTAQTAISPAQPEPKRRISPAIRQAITLYTTTGISKAEAARKAEIAEGTLYNALMKPHVKALENEIKEQYIQDVDLMRAPYKAQAIEVAKELMHKAKSEAVRMRAVEFFAGETKGNSVNVAVQVNNQPAQGYAYVRPGQDVVRIEPSPDSVSSDVVDVESIKQGD